MKKQSPPKWALSFIRLFYKESYVEQIEGDLYELFDRYGGTQKARVKFAINTLGFFRLRYLKGIDDFEQLTTLAMIKNYLKVAVRTLLKQKTFAGINIAGLAIGLAACLLISMYVFHERSYDNFYEDVDRIYRVANGTGGRWTPALLAETMAKDYPQVEAATKVSGLWEALIEIDDRSFVQEGTAYADKEIFNVFKMEFLAGDPENALIDPKTVVLTESLAKKLFPDGSSMGKSFKIDGESIKVTGVVKDPPRNTHFPFKYIISNPTDYDMKHYWTGNNHWTYAKIQKGVEPAAMNEQLLDLYKRYVGAEIIERSKFETFEQLVAEYPDRYFGYTVHPIRTIHLNKPQFSMGDRGDKENVLVFSIVALFILLIACVNYINMSTARSSTRSKEVGIRKAMGSYRKNIVMQFLVESLLITFIAIILAVIISGSSLNFFNQLTGRTFFWSDLFTFSNLLSVLTLLIVVGLLAGVYPAYVISGFSPIQALRGQIEKRGKTGLRSGLVTFQFAISVFLIAVTTGVVQQVTFMQSQDLGIEIEQTLVIQNGEKLFEHRSVFENELMQMPEVTKVAHASTIPFHGYPNYTYTLPNEDDKRVSPWTSFVSPGFEEVMDIEIVEGRFFDANRVNDTTAAIINESMAKELGWNDPIGKKLSRGEGNIIHVIGVMKDFNYTSLKRDIGPLIFRYAHQKSEVEDYHQSYIVINVNTSNIVSTINKMEASWDQQVPAYPFEATFLSDSYQKHYESEIKFGQVFTTFSGLAIFIAFLGLFALTTFVLQKRYKEIAVRKVLGASVPSLLRMIIKEFSKLVVIGGIIGVGLAFYWLSDWLNTYQYRISVTWYLLVSPILLILALTWVIVSLKSYRAAVSNPSNALKEE